MLPRSLQGTIRTLSRLITPAVFLSLWLAVTPAWAGSMTLLGVGGVGAAGPSGPVAFTFQSVAGNSTSAGVSTSTSQSIPNTAPASTRQLFVVLVTNNNNGSLVSATIGGVTASCSSFFDSVNSATTVGVCTALVTTGATATIVSNWAQSSGTVYSYLYAADSTTFSSLTPTLADGVGTGTSVTTSSFSTASGGGALMGGTNSTFQTSSISSGSNITPTQDSTFNVSVGGHANNLSVAAAATVTFGFPSGGNGLGVVFVFR